MGRLLVDRSGFGKVTVGTIDVVRVLEAAVTQRGTAPQFIRSDNGPEFIARAVREWIARQIAATTMKSVCIRRWVIKPRWSSPSVQQVV
jgi:transposase InsO family protein